ncbi:MAG: ATP-binding protein [Ruminococcus sp.]|nr:ATP-binding protein [Ruminococcus sp.]
MVRENPCPCGYYPTRKCRCTDYEIVKFRNRISGPILDRIDIQKHVEPVDLFDEKAVPAPSSRELKEHVERARNIQKKRFEHVPGVTCNASMSSSMIDEFCVLDPDTRTLLKKACDKFGYSARVIHKLLRLARTSADLVGSKNIRPEDISYVLHLRDLDKSSGTLGLM